MTLFYMCMYRFGECYQIIADNIETGKNLLKDKYISLYILYNGEDPEEEEINNMIDCIEITEMQLNKIFDPCE